MVVIVLVGVIGFLIYDSFIGDSSSSSSPSIDLTALEVPRIDSEFVDDFLTKSPYRNLVQYGRLPVEVSAAELGRNNPFRVITFISAPESEEEQQ